MPEAFFDPLFRCASRVSLYRPLDYVRRFQAALDSSRYRQVKEMTTCMEGASLLNRGSIWSGTEWALRPVTNFIEPIWHLFGLLIASSMKSFISQGIVIAWPSNHVIPSVQPRCLSCHLFALYDSKGRKRLERILHSAVLFDGKICRVD